MAGRKKNNEDSKHRCKNIAVDEEQCNSKKQSMKTATDVINRLLWDDTLPKEKFTVGYLDRFEGIMEKPFTSLDWSEPASVDYHTLALPKHRIQYFKYNNRKVWDKRTRTDIIFGSTGYVLSIYDFMSDVDQERVDFRDEDLPPLVTNSNTTEEISNDSDIEEEYDNSNRGNFFIAARIKSDTVVQNLKKVSDYIISKDELLGDCCVPSEKFHLTLCILKLDSPSDIIDTASAMKNIAAMNLPPVKLELEGLDNFHHRVLYSRVPKNNNYSDLLSLREKLTSKLLSRTITDKFSFVPHVTIAKLSRPVARMRHSNFIDQYLYLKFEDEIFGSETITHLCLCEMGAECQEDGFYRCACEVSLNQNVGS